MGMAMGKEYTMKCLSLLMILGLAAGCDAWTNQPYTQGCAPTPNSSVLTSVDDPVGSVIDLDENSPTFGQCIGRASQAGANHETVSADDLHGCGRYRLRGAASKSELFQYPNSSPDILNEYISQNSPLLLLTQINRGRGYRWYRPERKNRFNHWLQFRTRI